MGMSGVEAPAKPRRSGGTTMTPPPEEYNAVYGYIYLIRNKANGKVYVGQTSCSIKIRWSKHRSDAKRISRCIIHSAIAKHGVDSFEVEELCRCPDAATLTESEKFFIWILGATKKSLGYNLTYGGEGVSGTPETRKKQSESLKGHITSEETKRKMSEAHKKLPISDQHRSRLAAAGRSRVWTDEAKQKIGAAHKGLRHTEEARRKMSASRQGKPSSMLGKLHSAETKLKMSVAHKGQISVMRGKRHSEETKRKMSESHKQRILTNKGESHASS